MNYTITKQAAVFSGLFQRKIQAFCRLDAFALFSRTQKHPSFTSTSAGWMPMLAIVAALSFSLLLADGAETFRMLIDFGAPGTTTANGPAPDDAQFFWNNVTITIGTSNSATLSGLVTTTNQGTAVGLAMLSRFNGSNSEGTTDSTVYPMNATRDTLFGNTEIFNGLNDVFPSFKLTGLNPSWRYTLTFHASRLAVADNRETTYTVTGATTATASLNAATNVDEVVTVPAMRPTGAGEVTIGLTPGPNNNNVNHFTYLGILQVDATSSVPATLDNVSVRAKVRQGQNIMIAGFVIQGTGSKRVLIRGVGPTLGLFNVPGTLADPHIDLFRLENPPVVVAENDDWGLAANAAEIFSAGGALFAFDLPADSKDASLLLDLAAGRYTANVRGTNGETGAALVELYDADSTIGGVSTARISNLSMRGEVGSGDNVMIAGFVVGGEENKRLLLRVVGPELAQFNVQGVLPDPVLQTFSRVGGNVTLLANNDNWSTDEAVVATASAEVQAFPLTSGSTSAAMVLTLPPGIYTAHASSADGTLGVALVEVYELP